MAPSTKSVGDPAELPPGGREWSFVSGCKAAAKESPYRRDVRNGDRDSAGQTISRISRSWFGSGRYSGVILAHQAEKMGVEYLWTGPAST